MLANESFERGREALQAGVCARQGRVARLEHGNGRVRGVAVNKEFPNRVPDRGAQAPFNRTWIATLVHVSEAQKHWTSLFQVA